MIMIIVKSFVTFNVVFVKSCCTSVLILKDQNITAGYMKEKIIMIIMIISSKSKNCVCFFFVVTITSSCIRLGQEDREEKSNLSFVFYRREIKVYFIRISIYNCDNFRFKKMYSYQTSSIGIFY
jgi:hypothetical protein